MTAAKKTGTVTKLKPKKYYTLSPITWDSYESKCIRNNASFEVGFIRGSKQEPDKYMVYPVEREVKNKKQTSFHLVEHALKDIQSMGGYSRYNMQCTPMYEVEPEKKSKEKDYILYRPKETAKKTVTRKIKPAKYPITRILL